MSKLEPTRAIIESGETYEGSVIPTEKTAIDREVTVHAGATVTEGVYGHTVTIEEGATIDGPVMAKEAVAIEDAVVNGDIGTPGKVEATGATVHGTVTATRLRVVDSVVVGNVVAEKALLDDATVLGTAVGERTLKLADTTCYTFKSYIDGAVKNTNVLLPQVVVDGSFSFETPVTVQLIERKEEFIEGEGQRHPQLTDDDIHTVDGTTYATLVPRLLDIEPVETRIEQVEAFLRAVVLAQSNEEPFECPAESEWVLETLSVDAADLNPVV